VRLYGCKGCGSAAIEAALQLIGQTCELIRWDWEDEDGWARLALVNPLRQVPTLELDNGVVLTESAAILIWLLELQPDGGFAPPPGSPARAQLLRWLIFLTTNIYTPIGIGDFPERWMALEAARDSLKHGTVERSKSSWLIFERSVAPTPFLLGAQLTFLDLYVAMMTRWRPGRSWILEHCPRIAQAVAATESHPVVASVWRDNF
jgi:GST-like protein